MIKIRPSGVSSICANTFSFRAARIARRKSLSRNLHGLRTRFVSASLALRHSQFAPKETYRQFPPIV
jgi:hypothetical protein